MDNNILPRYDRAKNESHHPAVDESTCEIMAQRQGWQLKRIDRNKNKILAADCVFHGNVDLPKSFEN
jgi:hypothetical protein